MKKLLSFFLLVFLITSSPHLNGDCSSHSEYEYEFAGDPGGEYAYDPCCGDCEPCSGYVYDPMCVDSCDYGCGYRSGISTPCKILCVAVFAAFFGAVIAIGLKDANGSHAHH